MWEPAATVRKGSGTAKGQRCTAKRQVCIFRVLPCSCMAAASQVSGTRRAAARPAFADSIEARRKVLLCHRFAALYPCRGGKRLLLQQSHCHPPVWAVCSHARGAALDGVPACQARLCGLCLLAHVLTMPAADITDSGHRLSRIQVDPSLGVASCFTPSTSAHSFAALLDGCLPQTASRRGWSVPA